MTADASAEWITLAVVIKTQGRRGEVAVELHTDVPDRFHHGMQLWAVRNGNDRREVRVEDFWPHKGFLVLKFAGVETISDAETLKGAELQVPRAERAVLDPGWTYLSDLKGCLVLDGEREVGRITAVSFGAGEAPLLEVKGDAVSAYEIPFAEAYLEKIDLACKQVHMRLPEGLLDVNAPMTKEEKERSH